MHVVTQDRTKNLLRVRQMWSPLHHDNCMHSSSMGCPTTTQLGNPLSWVESFHRQTFNRSVDEVAEWLKWQTANQSCSESTGSDPFIRNYKTNLFMCNVTSSCNKVRIQLIKLFLQSSRCSSPLFFRCSLATVSIGLSYIHEAIPHGIASHIGKAIHSLFHDSPCHECITYRR